jgi:UDPglucose 6-dehydrogenase
MNIAVVGTGYVGLVTGTCLAETGNKVICVDIDTEKVKNLQNGKVPIYEPNLDTLFERNIKQGRLEFTTHLKNAVVNSQIVFLALPTPSGEDGSADLSYVLGVAKELGSLIENYTIVVDKSTVPVGTADLVKKEIEKSCKAEFDVVSNPEFLREGFAVNDFMKPERVIIGSNSEKAKSIMGKLFGPYVRQGNPILFMDARSAELTKYAANSFLATKISFMNEIANLCERLDADVDMVRIGMGSDSRIGKRFLFPGIGYGGSCFPKDVAALVKTGDIENSELNILSAVMSVNKYQKEILAKKVLAHYNGNVAGKHFALWGLAFKPDTDDVREAPSLSIINTLINNGATITAFDPAAMEKTKKLIGDKINYASDQYGALKGADALIIATEWAVFRTPDFQKAQGLLKESVIFDGRNLYELEQLKNEGYYYNSIGRKTISNT